MSRHVQVGLWLQLKVVTKSHEPPSSSEKVRTASTFHKELLPRVIEHNPHLTSSWGTHGESLHNLGTSGTLGELSVCVGSSHLQVPVVGSSSGFPKQCLTQWNTRSQHGVPQSICYVGLLIFVFLLAPDFMPCIWRVAWSWDSSAKFLLATGMSLKVPWSG